MPELYDTFLPLVQDLNDYGGNYAANLISPPILDTIDAGAANDRSLARLRNTLLATMSAWKGRQDHGTLSALFEAYYEAVFYLVALHRGLFLRTVPAGADKGETPDFQTASEPTVGFEIKTIDVADPTRTYDKNIEEGRNAKLEAQVRAAQTGVGVVGRAIAPHGNAKDRLEVVEQVMKKIDSNVKAGQYAAAPTFLVVSAARTALHQRAKNLRKSFPWLGEPHEASGQLFAIAAHQCGEPFYFFGQCADHIENLGPLMRAGVLRDHPFIAGLIFLKTEWSLVRQPDALERAFGLNGIWNCAWERDNSSGPQAVAAAKTAFEQLCHARNDTEDSGSALLPTR